MSDSVKSTLPNLKDIPIDAIVFDMDNTLFDLIKAKQMACREVAKYIGKKDGKKLFNIFLEEEDSFEDVNCIAKYLKRRNLFKKGTYEKCRCIYECEKLRHLQVYEGVHKTLRKLRIYNLKLGVVSDATKKNVYSRLSWTNLNQYFFTTVSKERTGKTKPSLKPIISTLKDLDANPRKSVLVGDSLRRDIVAGNKLGMITAHAEYGEYKRSISKKEVEPDFTLNKIYHLLNHIDKYSQNVSSHK